MGNIYPRISIVTPSYNQECYLQEAVESVVSQGYENLEYIVIDGGSSDNSVDIIRRYQSKINYWVSEPDEGQAHAINKAWKISNGEILGYLNSDDVLCPGSLKRVASIFREKPDVLVVYGDCHIINKKGSVIAKKTSEWVKKETLLMCKSLPQPSVFIRRKIFEDIGGFDQSLRYALDWAYFLKIFWKYPVERLVHIPEVLSMSREYAETKSRKGLSAKAEERRRVLSKYFKSGVLPLDRRDLVRQSLAATYWLQGGDDFVAGNFGRALVSAFLASACAPLSLLEKVMKSGKFFKKYIIFKNEK